MPEASLRAALQQLPPSSRLPGTALYAASLLEAAGLSPEEVAQWAQQQGGGWIEAGRLRLRKGESPERATVGRAERFVAIPDDALGRAPSEER